MAFVILVNDYFNLLAAWDNLWYISLKPYIQLLSKSYWSTLSEIARISLLLATSTLTNLVQPTIKSNLVCRKNLAILGHGPFRQY